MPGGGSDLPTGGLNDLNLFRSALAVERNLSSSSGYRPRKLAFMFLTRGPLPLAPFWARFFAGHKDLFNIYIHTHESFVYQPGSLPEIFRGRQIHGKDVVYASMSVVDAERRLIAHAMLDSENARFILLSESCIPLFNFTFVYNFLIQTERSFVRGASYGGRAGTGRWHPGFLPHLSKKQWRKGSQWIVLNRPLAAVVLNDTKLYSTFKKQCKWTPHRCCCADEHYIQSMAHLLQPASLTNHSLTWVQWPRRVRSSPISFGGKHVSLELLGQMRAASNCSFLSGDHKQCYLFARKFRIDTLPRLLDISKDMGF